MLSKVLQRFTAASLFLANAYYLNKIYQKRQARCCGIYGFIGKTKNAETVLIDGVKVLQSRGYDAAGSYLQLIII